MTLQENPEFKEYMFAADLKHEKHTLFKLTLQAQYTVQTNKRKITPAFLTDALGLVIVRIILKMLPFK